MNLDLKTTANICSVLGGYLTTGAIVNYGTAKGNKSAMWMQAAGAVAAFVADYAVTFARSQANQIPISDLLLRNLQIGFTVSIPLYFCVSAVNEYLQFRKTKKMESAILVLCNISLAVTTSSLSMHMGKWGTA